jgi:hypothetical protein
MSFVLPVSAAWMSFIVAGTVAILLARSHGPVVRAAVVAGLYRPQYGTWFVLESSSNYTQYVTLGWGASVGRHGSAGRLRPRRAG